MADAFLPLFIADEKNRDTTFFSIHQRTAAANKVDGEPANRFDTSCLEVAPPAANCSKPAVTLQRNGDQVTSIRIQCGCGQVIELNCEY